MCARWVISCCGRGDYARGRGRFGVIGDLGDLSTTLCSILCSLVFQQRAGLSGGDALFKSIWDGSYVECYRIKTANERMRMMGLLAGYTVLVALVFMQTAMPLLFLPVNALVLLTFPLGRQGSRSRLSLPRLSAHWPPWRGMVRFP
jgi:hypothetical protein